MVRASSGFRRGTRRKLKKSLRSKFKPNTFMTDFKPGDIVIVKHDPASQAGMPHPRFRSQAGEIVEKRGNGYLVDLRAGKTTKRLVVRGEHLKPAGK